ncbi:MAG: MFS transporter [Nitrososphaera sp.]|nr:MFS transporter [Nitrososphaera sp.]
MATGLSVLVTGILVDWFAGLVPGIADQSGLTVNRIGLLYSVVPATLVIASGGLMLRYRLTRSRTVSIQTELRTRNGMQQVYQRSP